MRCMHDFPYEGENACPICSKAYKVGIAMQGDISGSYSGPSLMSRVDAQVAEFHKVMGIPDRDLPGLVDDETLRLRMRLILEEAFEFAEACLDRTGQDDMVSYKRRVLALISRSKLEPDLPEMADALGDIDYVVAGTRCQLGIKGVAIADEIHRSNMEKAPCGVVKRDEFGKVQKPEGWEPPNIKRILFSQGWQP